MEKNVQKLLDQLTKLHTDLASATPVNAAEKPAEKRLRIKYLEQNHEEWFKYYFPVYASAPPAQFHKDAADRVINNPEFYEVRNWSRELAKSTRTMLEVFYLTLVGNPVGAGFKRKKNVLIISNSYDNAERLLLPYQVNFAKNNRLINDYGEQQNIGSWGMGEFITKKGTAFRAIGAGQSPRGTRNEAARPDIIIFDDLDTDEDCRNSDIVDKHWKWVEEAVIPTRSISTPLLVIWCGNIISEDCCVVRAQALANHVDIVNIRNAEGLSSWPEKNSEADIDRVLSIISYSAQQKEYFNNPMSVGKSFPSITWGSCPPLSSLPFIVVYADPATSNKDRPSQSSNLSNSRKAIFIMGRQGAKYYIYTGFLDVMSQANFIRDFYETRKYINNLCPAYYLIECNTLQGPFHEQVIAPLNYDYGQEHGGALPLMKDERKKDEKWFRIEAQLEPLNRDGNLIFNIEEKDNPHMKRLEAQFKAARPNSKELDGPDCIEGAKFIIDQKSTQLSGNSFRAIKRQRSSTKGF